MSKVVKVSMESISSNNTFNYIYARCNFCEKEVTMMQEEFYKDSIKLGHGYFYCPFCVRNQFNYKKRKNILLMDFKGIVGFYINYLYNEGTIYNSQIIDYIRKHSIVGLKNSIFSYDHESMLWFLDFTRVGQERHKVSIESVVKTTEDIIKSFDVNKNVKNCNPQKILDKYEESLKEFYTSRKRPEGKRILSPTLKNCAYRAQIDWDSTKNFQINSDLIDLIPVGFCESSNDFSLKINQYIEDYQEPAIEELNVVIKQRKYKGIVKYEGYINLPGVSSSKLATKDGDTLFEERRSVLSLANKMAKKLGLKLIVQKPHSIT